MKIVVRLDYVIGCWWSSFVRCWIFVFIFVVVVVIFISIFNLLG